MPLSAIDDDFVPPRSLDGWRQFGEKERGLFEVTIALSADTVGQDPGQLVNMLFGNTSLHEDVVLADVTLAGEPGAGVRRAAPWTAWAAGAVSEHRSVP